MCVAIDRGRLALSAEKWTRLPATMVMPSSHWGNNGHLLFIYVANMVTYLYLEGKMVYLKVTVVNSFPLDVHLL